MTHNTDGFGPYGASLPHAYDPAAGASKPAARPIVAGSEEDPANRGQFFPIPTTAFGPIVGAALRLDEGNWQFRAVPTNPAGELDASAKTTFILASMRLGIGRGQYVDPLFIPQRGLVWSRSFDSCNLTVQGTASKAVSLFIGARKMTGPAVPYSLAGNTLAVGATTVVVPPFACKMMVTGVVGDTFQFRDGAGANVGALLGIDPGSAGVFPEWYIPRDAFDVVITLAGRGTVDWLAYA